ncbi:glutamine amidotransferase [Aquimarina sp. TRL1]|uniref:DJ-1/PfpI family protein n=1 Tax=Aquimarina sp. (strain TRL1) TaxID=2736252 RepID=UPI00158EA560|nr:DJ-1/PfpI family protein [Aquimarina sp. TRL1]QKX05736.1 glutamine amidotransferase [Aquimarina sp. TRL1]
MNLFYKIINTNNVSSLWFLLFFFLLSHCTEVPKKQKEQSSSTVTLAPNRYNVAFLIMDGTYNTELTAPYDIFQHTIFRKNIKPMNVFTVANTHEPITTFEGMRLLPDFNYRQDTLPHIDILVIPSAEHHLDTDLDDTDMIDFVKKTAEQASFVTSHCDGAFVLAQAGLLDGKVATTFPGDIDTMRQKFPHLDIREQVFFVHDGKYITSSGGAKSFEAALYLTEYLYGTAIAKSLAKGLVIDWNLDKIPYLLINK